MPPRPSSRSGPSRPSATSRRPHALFADTPTGARAARARQLEPAAGRRGAPDHHRLETNSRDRGRRTSQTRDCASRGDRQGEPVDGVVHVARRDRRTLRSTATRTPRRTFREAVRLRSRRTRRRTAASRHALIHGEDHEGALAAAQESVRLAPGDPRWLEHASESRSRTSDGLEEAVKPLEEALKLEPEEPSTLCNLGRALMKRGELERAVRFSKRATRTDRSSRDGHCVRGSGCRGRRLVALEKRLVEVRDGSGEPAVPTSARGSRGRSAGARSSSPKPPRSTPRRSTRSPRSCRSTRRTT